MEKKKVLFLCIAIAVSCILAASCLTYYFTKTASKQEMYISGEQYDRLMTYFELDEIEKLIDDNYYTEIDADQLAQGSLQGMVEALGDGYSRYYPSEDFAYMDERTEGSYIGQGLMLEKDDLTGYMTVVRVFADTPAYDANILEGDLITLIDGRDTRLIDVENAVSRLRGQDGTTVTLSLISSQKELHIEFVRKSPELQIVFTDMLTEDVGYIDLIEFSENSVEGFQDAITTLEEEGARAVVIDVRDVPGGYISQVTQIADMLLDEGEIYSTVGRGGETSHISADKQIEFSIPAVLIVNENTTGVAEVFAAALQENDRAVLVGQQTAGKGVALSMLQLPTTGDGIRLVTARYCSPNGKMINEGVVPDYQVIQLAASDQQKDAQLAKALTIAEEMI